MRPLVLALLTSSLTGCMASEPDIGTLPEPDPNEIPTPPEPQEVPLNLQGASPTTHWNSVPVRGTGPADGSVVIDNNGTTSAKQLGGDGTFCVDVPLNKGTNNTLVVTAYKGGKESAPQTLTVAQDGVPPQPGEPIPAQNILAGGLTLEGAGVFNNLYADNGEEISQLTDGKIGETISLWEGNFTSRESLTLTVPNPAAADKIRVYSDPLCQLVDYDVVVARAHENPTIWAKTGDPAQPWFRAGQYRQNGGEEHVNPADCSTPQLQCEEYDVREFGEIGIVGIEIFDFEDNCATGIGGFFERAKVAEIELITPPRPAPNNISAPSCDP